MQVMPPDGTNVIFPIWWPNLERKLRHLVVKFVTNASSATWWPKLEPMLITILVALPGGKIFN